MSEAKLRIVTASIPPDLANEVFAAIREIEPSSSHSMMALMSYHPPTWVEMFADFATWKTILAVPVTAFFTRVAQHVADAGWEKRQAALASLKECATTTVARAGHIFRSIAKVKQGLGRGCSLHFMFPGPGTAKTMVDVPASELEEFENHCLLLAAWLDGVETAIRSFEQRGIRPALYLHCKLEDDGFTIRWQDYQTLLPFVQRFSPGGAPIGEPICTDKR